MKKVLIFLISLFALFLIIQSCAKKLMDNATFQVAPSHESPSAIGQVYQEIAIIHKERKVRMWLVKAGKNKLNNTSVLFFSLMALEVIYLDGDIFKYIWQIMGYRQFVLNTGL